MNIDGEAARAQIDMETAEQHLINTGFREDQWLLIKQYVYAALSHSHLAVLKRLQGADGGEANP